MTDSEQTPQEKAAAVIARLGVTMTAERIVARPDRAGDDWEKTAYHYRVTLARGDHALLVNYSMGSAHVEKVPYADAIKSLRKQYAFHNDYTRADWERCPKPGAPTTLFLEKFRDHVWQPKAPQIADVLYSLVMDASALDHPSFESWAADYGYETDSRKAEATYRACLENALKLRAMVGESGMRELSEAFAGY